MEGEFLPLGVWTGMGCVEHLNPECECCLGEIHLGVYQNHLYLPAWGPHHPDRPMIYPRMEWSEPHSPPRRIARQIRKQNLSFCLRGDPVPLGPDRSLPKSSYDLIRTGSVTPIRFPAGDPFGLIRGKEFGVEEGMGSLLFLGEMLRSLNKIETAKGSGLEHQMVKRFHPTNLYENLWLKLYVDQLTLSFWANVFFPKLHRVRKHLDEVQRGYCVVGGEIDQILQLSW